MGLTMCSTHAGQHDRPPASSTLSTLHPSSRHLHGFLPSCIHVIAFFRRDLRLEDHTVLSVDFFQFFELLPDLRCKSCGDSSSKSSGLTHYWPIYWDTNNVRLCLWRCAFRLDDDLRKQKGTYLHAEIGVAHPTVHR